MQFVHRWWAWAVAIAVFLLALAAWRARRPLRSVVLMLLVGAQIVLGIETLLTGVQLADRGRASGNGGAAARGDGLGGAWRRHAATGPALA